MPNLTEIGRLDTIGSQYVLYADLNDRDHFVVTCEAPVDSDDPHSVVHESNTLLAALVWIGLTVTHEIELETAPPPPPPPPPAPPSDDPPPYPGAPLPTDQDMPGWGERAFAN